MDLLNLIRGNKPRHKLHYYAACLLVCSGSLQAQDGKLMSEQLTKRVEGRQEAGVFLEQGDKAYRAGDFEKATMAYGQAVELLPEQAPAVSELRQAAVKRYAQATVEQARVLSRTGDYQAAEKLLDQADAAGMAEDDPGVDLMRGKLDDPIRNNPALTPEHAANVDKVRRLLYQAQGEFDLGKFDQARAAYESVLRVDPYNKAARRGVERTNASMSAHSRAAYDQRRAAMLAEVDKQWELSTLAAPKIPVIGSGNGDSLSGQKRMSREKLASIKVDQVDLDDATLEESIDYLRVISVRNDTVESDETQKGIGFVVDLGSPGNPRATKIQRQRVTLRLRNVTLRKVLEEICNLTGTDYRVDQYAVVVHPRGAVDENLSSRSFRVPPDFLTREAVSANGGSNDPFATEAKDESLMLGKMTAEQKLKNLGVKFPDGASASFNSNNSQLRVRNTPAQLGLVAEIASIASETEPVAVVVRSYILEVEQESLEELGFDWSLGSINPGSDLVLSGGSKGNGITNDALDTGNPVTAGLRSGASAVAPDGLDRLLSRANIATPSTFSRVDSLGNVLASSSNTPGSGSASFNARAPGILSLKQVIDGNVTQALLTGLSQHKGTDLMSQDEVITRSGQNASIESVREFIYPTEYEPPQIPNSVGGGGTTPVTPAQPTAFEMIKLGSVLEVLPQVSANRKLVNVSVKPTIKRFEGFVNYGVPIVAQSESFGALPGPPEVLYKDTISGELTRNAILMPLFKTIRTSTEVTVADGQTIVIGGLLETSHQRVDDGVPILKDLPLLGRLFENEVDSVKRKAVMIFVNVELLDPSGQPYRYR